MATRTQVVNFINMIAPQVVEVCKSKSRKVLPSVCIAQACFESGYGTVDRMINANAVFGVKVGQNQVKFGTAWKGKAYNTKTKECYDGSTYVTITDMFRAYDSVRDSIEDYYDLLGSCSRYAKCIGVKDPKKAITEIKNGGYATDPNYINVVMSIINYNTLTKYDACMNNINSIATEQPAVDNTPASKTNHKVGETIRVNTYYSTSVSEDNPIYNNKTGVILRIIEGAKNPYCFGDAKSKIAIGWCNDNGISNSNEPLGRTTHVVKSGDTLFRIALNNKTTVDAIVKTNKYKYPSITPNFIRVGWVLEI